MERKRLPLSLSLPDGKFLSVCLRTCRSLWLAHRSGCCTDQPGNTTAELPGPLTSSHLVGERDAHFPWQNRSFLIPSVHSTTVIAFDCCHSSYRHSQLLQRLDFILSPPQKFAETDPRYGCLSAKMVGMYIYGLFGFRVLRSSAVWEHFQVWSCC